MRHGLASYQLESASNGNWIPGSHVWISDKRVNHLEEHEPSWQHLSSPSVYIHVAVRDTAQDQ